MVIERSEYSTICWRSSRLGARRKKTASIEHSAVVDMEKINVDISSLVDGEL